MSDVVTKEDRALAVDVVLIADASLKGGEWVARWIETGEGLSERSPLWACAIIASRARVAERTRMEAFVVDAESARLEADRAERAGMVERERLVREVIGLKDEVLQWRNLLQKHDECAGENRALRAQVERLKLSRDLASKVAEKAEQEAEAWNDVAESETHLRRKEETLRHAAENHVAVYALSEFWGVWFPSALAMTTCINCGDPASWHGASTFCRQPGGGVNCPCWGYQANLEDGKIRR